MFREGQGSTTGVFAQAAIRDADFASTQRVALEHRTARIASGAGWARDLNLVGAVFPYVFTCTIAIAALILLDAGCGFVTGVEAYTALATACFFTWRIRSPGVAVNAVDPIIWISDTVRTVRGHTRGHVARRWHERQRWSHRWHRRRHQRRRWR